MLIGQKRIFFHLVNQSESVKKKPSGQVSTASFSDFQVLPVLTYTIKICEVI